MALSFLEPELWAVDIYIAGISILDVFDSCDLYLDPMTFLYEPDPYCLEITGCANMNFIRQGFQKLSSDRQTESTEIINQTASRVVKKRYQHYSADCICFTCVRPRQIENTTV